MSYNFVMFVQSQLIFAVGYIMYLLFFRKDVHLQARRAYLLLLMPLSICIPMLQQSVASTSTVMQTIYLTEPVTINATLAPQQGFTFNWWMVYALISIIFLMYTIYNVMQLFRMRSKLHIVNHGHYRLIEDANIRTPFSFFRTIFMPANLNLLEYDLILKHEIVHVQQRHTIDVLFADVMRAFNWINPFSWLLCKELKLVHECIADAEAGKQDAGVYAELLVSNYFEIPQNQFANHFFQPSQLKQRLMLLQTDAPKRTMRYALMLLPFFIAIGIINLKADVQLPKTDMNQSTVTNVNDTIPQFVGGQAALIDFLVKNVKYPETAQKSGMQGTVIVAFTVSEKGKIKNAEVIKSINKDLDAEALRVVKSMPNWEPAMKNEKATSAQVVLPISFRLN